MRFRGEPAAMDKMETNHLVSPPPRPSFAATEERSGNRRTQRTRARPMVVMKEKSHG
ncbi:protein of unknown function [Candidatus Promineifilum breve]|uniref:Uncharacterized protein n=1 Tax=Candidatus Promineifilum breve TaxID=1806508 RepID=A0A160T437_9CHLR|nr:protein of unknown function [Candidatus Promineifilum breve]